jgi:hypothetical protein
MAKVNRLRVYTWLLLAVLSSAVMTRTMFAEEGGSTSHSRSLQLTHHRGTISFEAGVAGRIRGHWLRVSRSPAGVEGEEFDAGVAGRVRAHWLRASRSPAGVERNAIGLRIAPQHAIEGTGEGPVGLHAPSAFPGAAAGETTGLAHEGLSGPGIAHWHSNPMRTSVNGGAIDGSRLIRPGLTPTTVGGPAKSTVGINGSTFRPKR